MKKEITVGPYSYSEARDLLVKLQDGSGKFYQGGRPYIGDLKKSEGYGKKIGLISHDKQVRTRMDWDENKGVHINYEDFENDIKICILISDWTKETYVNFIKNQNKGYTDDNLDMQIWKSKREEGVTLDGYIHTSLEVNKELFRKPSVHYRTYCQSLTGKMQEEIEKKAK